MEEIPVVLEEIPVVLEEIPVVSSYWKKKREFRKWRDDMTMVPVCAHHTYRSTELATL